MSTLSETPTQAVHCALEQMIWVKIFLLQCECKKICDTSKSDIENVKNSKCFIKMNILQQNQTKVVKFGAPQLVEALYHWLLWLYETRRPCMCYFQSLVLGFTHMDYFFECLTWDTLSVWLKSVLGFTHIDFILFLRFYSIIVL